MMSFGIGGTGMILIGLAVMMFVVALPRDGEAAPFLRGKDNLQAAYVLGIVAATVTGIAFVANSLTR